MADWYVDFGAANDGDGTAYTQAGSGGATGAFNTLLSKSFSSGDKVWIRRVEKTGQTSVWTFNNTNVDYIGWPLSGDKFYASRPDGGAHAAWDGDSDTHAKITHTSQAQPISVTTGEQRFYRMHFHSSLNSTSYNVTINTASLSIRCKFYNCIAEASGASSFVFHNNWYINSPVDMYDCEGRYPGGTSSKSGTTYGAAFYFTASGVNPSYCNLIRCTATIHTSSPARTLMAGILTSGIYLTVVDFTVGGTATAPSLGLQGVNATGLRVIGGNWKGTTCFEGTGANNYWRFHNVRATAFTTLISLGSGGGHYLAFRECVQAASTTQPISLNSTTGGILVLDAVDFHASNTYNFHVPSGSWPIFMRNCTNIKTVPNNTSSSNQFWPGYQSTDHEGVAGAFKIVNDRATCDASATVRTGGEAFSLKFESLNFNNVPGADILLGWPGFETIWVALVAGSNTLTMYGSHKGFSTDPPTKDDLWFEFDYMDGAGDVDRVSVSTREAADLESDASGWTGDTSLTEFKITKTVTVGQDCVVPVRLGYGKYVASAYTYVDPKIVVT